MLQGFKLGLNTSAVCRRRPTSVQDHETDTVSMKYVISFICSNHPNITYFGTYSLSATPRSTPAYSPSPRVRQQVCTHLFICPFVMPS